jgi:hypothetical protein
MCTVSLVPHERGIRLVCNRDERRTRPAALPPAVHQIGGRRALFPIDPQGGGTWIGANDTGLVVTLLNAHATGTVGSRQRAAGSSETCNCDRREEARTWARSRGLIVRELLGCQSFERAIAAVGGVDGSAFAPFRLLILQGRSLLVAASDGVGPPICTFLHVDEPLLFTSSSLGDAIVEAPRRRLFERIVVSRPDKWLNGQARFHRHRWPSRPEISVVMERHDARTVSRTVIDVVDGKVRLRHRAPPLGPARQDVLEW